MNHTVYIALGTNLNDRLGNLQAATKALSPTIHISAVSPIYVTPPWGFTDQPDFLNQVLVGETDLTPQALLSFLKLTEGNLGRIPTFRNGPRIIDLDLIFYDDLVLETMVGDYTLSIPHNKMDERAFVLVPLVDLAPDLRHPVTGYTMRQLLDKVDTTGIHQFHET